MVTHRFDVIVLGAGAAGLMCAIEAGRRGRRVAVVERAAQIGKKILISGGGRCNFTNLHCRPENFLSANPHFFKSALARFTSAHFIERVEKHGIPYHEKTLGQLFCDRSARDIVGMLESECRETGVRIFAGVAVEAVSGGGEYVLSAGADEYRAAALVVACGGLSIPKIGATSFGYELARQFGVGIQPTRPGLVPLVLNRDDVRHYCDLAGVATEVVATFGRQSFREKMLITHRGLSGPAILQISSYWDGKDPISIDLAPGRQVMEPLLREASGRDEAAARSALRTVLPNRLADRWLELHRPDGWSNRQLEAAEGALHRWMVMPSGTEGYEKAEVTAGGVDTAELSAKTMECRKVSGLFFIGEVVDVTGQLGGFNFQWAWASGWCAGQAV